jgi:hypothetical protein
MRATSFKSFMFPLTARAVVFMLLLVLQFLSNIKDTPAGFFIEGSASNPSAITIRTKMVRYSFPLYCEGGCSAQNRSRVSAKQN